MAQGSLDPLFALPVGDMPDMDGLEKQVRQDLRSVIEEAVTEKEFLATVIAAAHKFNWLAYHTWDSHHSARGFPDLCLVRLSRVLFIEVKSEKGKTTPDQKEWLEALELTGKVEVYIWHPSDIERIVEILR